MFDSKNSPGQRIEGFLTVTDDEDEVGRKYKVNIGSLIAYFEAQKKPSEKRILTPPSPSTKRQICQTYPSVCSH